MNIPFLFYSFSLKSNLTAGVSLLSRRVLLCTNDWDHNAQTNTQSNQAVVKKPRIVGTQLPSFQTVILIDR